MAAGYGDDSAQTAMGAPPSQDLEMPAEQVREWIARIELDRQRRKRESDKWKALYEAYLPPHNQGLTYATQQSSTDINSNIHFRNTHLKQAEIFAQWPELILTPLAPLGDLRNPQTGQPTSPDEIVAIKRAVLNKLLGRDHAYAELTAKSCLFDIFQTSGIAATKIHYQADMQAPPADAATEPTPQPGAILGLGAPAIAPPQPVAVNERWRWDHFSAEKLIIPADWHSTMFDEAPYLGMEFVEVLTEQARKAYNLPADFQPNVSRDDLVITRDTDLQTPGTKQLFKGVEIWLYACHFDPTVAHTQLMRRLVLIDGLKDRASIYRNSPYQTLLPNGRLSPDSMIGNPIHIITLRVATDTAWIPADAAFTDPLVRIENTWMAQDVKMRDANLPRFLHSDKVTAAVDKLKNTDTGQGAAITHELMVQGLDRLIAPLPKLEHAQADTQARIQNQRAITETLGLGANQAGAPSQTVRSATEVATIQANVSVRLKGEQNAFLSELLRMVRKFDALVQRYMTEPGYITIVGQNGAQRLVPYTQAHLSGYYAYDALIDSQLSYDMTTRRKEFTDYINFFAKSGFLNLHNAVRRGSIMWGEDPALMVQDPKPPPPPPPEQPKVSVAIKAIDLAIPEVQMLLGQLGIKLPPAPSQQLLEAIQRENAQPQHGGAANKVDLVEKHEADQTGNQPGAPPQGVPPARALPPGAGMVQ